MYKIILKGCRPWTVLAVALGVVVTCALGVWQLSRAHERLARQARIERWENAPPVTVGGVPLSLADVEYHRVRLVGRFVRDRVVYLDNRPHDGQPGFDVVMLFDVGGGRYVMINRGWMPRDLRDRTAIMPYPTPLGEVEIEGVARENPGRTFALSHQSEAGQKIRQNVDVADYARETGLSLQPFTVLQTSALDDHLVRDWPAPASGAARNYGYAAQWFGLALVLVLMGVGAAYRRGKAIAAASRPTNDRVKA